MQQAQLTSAMYQLKPQKTFNHSTNNAQKKKKKKKNTKVRKMFCGSPQHNQFFHQRYLLLG